MNQVINAHANFNRTSKILDNVPNENLFVECCSERAFFWVCHACLKISVQPSCDFCISHRYQKINKCLRADSCEASEGGDSGSKGLLHFSDASRL
jgi:hypothetical protein